MAGLPRDFPQEAFFIRAIVAFNDDADAAAATVGWEGDFGIVLDAAAGARCFYIGAPEGGRLPEPVVVSEPELDRRGPAWFARASEATWGELLTGGLDPIAAIVQKRLVVRGDLRPVVERLQYRGLAMRWLARLRSGGP